MNAVFAHTLETVPADSRRHAFTQRIQGFILRHLRDPGLDPRRLAAANHISVSYLHRLFQQEGVTVSAWIKQQRLERSCTAS
ncbi:hypothetical protein ACIBO5_12855 [Nonomuraea angiospora]|uniref:hypothetical protein n=1 Tax=Nonomuraea angiospora TaxID=46172 RepID=UPI0029B973FB|nr:hypothetical protein [Nonomuraea angiospora]MDX3107532.1 hypothetical protein [Nonomuraea angiospora]